MAIIFRFKAAATAKRFWADLVAEKAGVDRTRILAHQVLLRGPSTPATVAETDLKIWSSKFMSPANAGQDGSDPNG